MRKAQAHTEWLSAAACIALAVVGCGGESQGGASGGGPPRSAISGPLPAEGDLLFVMRGPATVTKAKARPMPEGRRTEGVTDKRDPQVSAREAAVRDRVEVRAETVE